MNLSKRKTTSFRDWQLRIFAIAIFGTMFGLYLFDSVNLIPPYELSLNVDMITPQYNAAGFPPWIDGNFTIDGTGPVSLVNLTLYLDGIVLKSVIGNKVTFFLNTRLYTQGRVNLTLWGQDSNGEFFQKSKIFFFTPNLITYSMIVLFSATGSLIIDALIVYYLQHHSKDEDEISEKKDVEIEPI